MRRLLCSGYLVWGVVMGCRPALDTPRPCDGVNDPRYSCRAVPVLRPEPVQAD